MTSQRTLRNAIRATGVGWHFGKQVQLELRPAAVDTGIVFRRVDVDRPVEIPALIGNVGDSRLSTTLVRGDVAVTSVAHLLSAFAALGIDNAYVDVNAAEVPIMDGSASPFVFLIQSAGVLEQAAPRRYLRVKRPVEVRGSGDAFARLEPYEGLKVACGIELRHPACAQRTQSASIDFASTSFVKEVSRARTFGFLEELEALKRDAQAVGSSTRNVVVLDDYRVVNEDGLRYRDEFARHAIVDAIGDLCLLHSGLIGAFSAFNAGHALHNRLLRAFLADSSAWDEVVSSDPAGAAGRLDLARAQAV